MKHQEYTRAFYEDMSRHACDAAAVTVPLLIEHLRPTSVADVGCGEGAWLREFQTRGVADIAGFDLPLSAGQQLLIPDAAFHATDFREGVQARRRYDLALCLEVAEHLPPERARPLVQTLTELADVVVFSAAIPGQGGTLHLNEQWPQYWSDLFSQHEYIGCDVLRRCLWNDSRVAFWYSQNMFVAVNKNAAFRYDWLRRAVTDFGGVVLPLVHPNLYRWKSACLIDDLRPEGYAGGKALQFCLRVLRAAICRRIKGRLGPFGS